MIITLHATGMELTEALKQYCNEKVSGLVKYFDNIQKAEVDIGMRTHHHQKGKIYYCDVNIHIPGKIVRVEKDAEDLYKAIDKVKDHLKVELQDAKERMRDRDRGEMRQQKEYVQ